MIKRFIFTVTAGRTGTRYLSDLLLNCEGVLAEHEGLPTPGTLLRRMNLGMDFVEYSDAWARMKACDLVDQDEEIRRSQMIPNWTCETYVDTSHQMAKSVLHPQHPSLLDALFAMTQDEQQDFDLQLVHLTRDRRKTAESLLSIGAYPSLWPNPLGFALTPDHPFVEPWPGWVDVIQMPYTAMDHHSIPGRLALVLWYLRQIDRIAEQAKRKWPGKVQAVDIADLNTMEGCEALVGRLGLTLTEHAVNVIGKPRNTTKQRGHARIAVTHGHWRQAEAIFADWLAGR